MSDKKSKKNPARKSKGIKYADDKLFKETLKKGIKRYSNALKELAKR